MARLKKVAEPKSNAEILLEIANSLEQQATKPNIYGYEPHHKQSYFHKFCSETPTTLYIGGNRSGKSYGAVAEDIRTCMKLSKWAKEIIGPVRGRVVGVDFDRGIAQILFPIFKILCPKDALRGGSWDSAYNKKERILNFDNGSTIQFMSYEQSTEKFAGTSLHFVHYDEEPPKNIYDECQARLVDTEGHSWISMTPVEGMTWLYDKLYSKAEDAPSRMMYVNPEDGIGPVWTAAWDNDGYEQKLSVVEVDMGENPYLTESARKSYLGSLDKDDRVARQKGQFVQRAGKVFGVFQVTTHVTKEDFDVMGAVLDGWQIYTSTDHGWNNPTAWYWHAVSPMGRVITFREHYESHMTIKEHSDVVKSIERGWGLPSEAVMRTGDPAMHQTSAITGTSVVQEYANNDIYIYTESVPKDPAIGIGKMQQYFRIREDGSPTWMIHESCTNLIKELKNLRWAVFSSPKVRYDNNPQEKVHKKDDHGFDSCKYFATFLNDLTPEKPRQEGQPRIIKTDTMRYDTALVRQLEDTRRNSMESEWTLIRSFD